MTRMMNMINRLRLLFVCSGNASRSPSFENWFRENRPQYDVMSAGTNYGCQVELTDEFLECADKIYIMDLSHELIISRDYPEYLHKCEVVGIKIYLLFTLCVSFIY